MADYASSTLCKASHKADDLPVNRHLERQLYFGTRLSVPMMTGSNGHKNRTIEAKIHRVAADGPI